MAGQGKAPVLVWAARALSRGAKWEEREEDYSKENSEMNRGLNEACFLIPQEGQDGAAGCDAIENCCPSRASVRFLR